MQVPQDPNAGNENDESSDLVPPLCFALAGKNQNDFINFQDGFLDKLDSFEEIDENWNGENEKGLFTGGTNSAMAWQVLSNWEPMPADQRVITNEFEHHWEVMPETATPTIYNINVPNYNALDRFVPHGPKKM